MTRFKKFLPLLAALSVIAAFLLAYSFLPLTTPDKFSSPDEAANFYFGRQWAERTTLWFFDETTIPSGGIVHPRSMRVVDTFIVPVGFLGLPFLYGSVAKALGTGAMPFITPIMSVLGVLAWYGLVKHWFGKRVGIVAAALLLAQPAWWYVSSRTMQPNVLFCALFIISEYFFFVTPFRAMLEKSGTEGKLLLRNSDPVLAGIFLALALAVRTSEAYWILAGGLTLAIIFRKQLPWKKLVLEALGFALAFAPFMALNHSTYGGLLATGYGDVGAGINDAMQGFGNKLLGPLRPYLFPLGFAPNTALDNALTYGVGFFWWWSVLLVMALWAYVQQREKFSAETQRKVRAFTWLATVVAGWLVLFYGSWIVTDSPDPNAVSIGSSYFRYWLPIAVLSTVPIAWWLEQKTSKHGARSNAVLAGALAVITLVSGATVFTAKGEGLLATRAAILRHTEIAEDIIATTPGSAIIVTDYDDKYLFPDRRVIWPLRSEATYNALPKLVGFGPLYYLGITFPGKDFAYLRDTLLKPRGLEPVLVKSYDEQSLYELRPIPDASSEETKPAPKKK